MSENRGGRDLRPGSRVLITDLVGRRVHTSDDHNLGPVIDIELVVDEGGVRVVALELGRYGLLDRFHLTRPVIQRLLRGKEPRVVAWEDVERLEEGRVVIRGRGQQRA